MFNVSLKIKIGEPDEKTHDRCHFRHSRSFHRMR